MLNLKPPRHTPTLPIAVVPLATTVGAVSALIRRSYSCSDLVGYRPATIGIGARVVGHAPSDYPSGRAGDALMVEFTVAGILVSASTAVPRSSITKPSRSRSPPTISTRPTAIAAPRSPRPPADARRRREIRKSGVAVIVVARVITRPAAAQSIKRPSTFFVRAAVAAAS